MADAAHGERAGACVVHNVVDLPLVGVVVIVWLREGVGESRVHDLLSDEPRLGGHELADLVLAAAGLGRVDVGHGLDDGLRLVLRERELVGRVPSVHADVALVDHEHAAGMDHHLVACAGDDARCGRGEALDVDRLGARQLLQRVVDRDARENVAAA